MHTTPSDLLEPRHPRSPGLWLCLLTKNNARCGAGPVERHCPGTGSGSVGSTTLLGDPPASGMDSCCASHPHDSVAHPHPPPQPHATGCRYQGMSPRPSPVHQQNAHDSQCRHLGFTELPGRSRTGPRGHGHFPRGFLRKPDHFSLPSGTLRNLNRPGHWRLRPRPAFGHCS